MLKKIFKYLINSLLWSFYKDKLVVSAHVKISNGRIERWNWGDDINVFLLEAMTGLKVIVANKSLYHLCFPQRNYLCIGSILGWCGNHKTEVWGAGMIDEKQQLSSQIIVHSVRGKKTREVLINQGIKCPEVYGDPALLLPRVYKPNVTKKYKLGIIPHIEDLSNALLLDFIKLNKKNVLLINLADYKNWTDVIDEINECDYVISSSLHGLIVADAYKIPNSWIRLSNKILGGDFKFLDYFSSVERETTTPIQIMTINDLYDLLHSSYIYKPVRIDYDAIIDSCPFKELLNLKY